MMVLSPLPPPLLPLLDLPSTDLRFTNGVFTSSFKSERPSKRNLLKETVNAFEGLLRCVTRLSDSLGQHDADPIDELGIDLHQLNQVFDRVLRVTLHLFEYLLIENLASLTESLLAGIDSLVLEIYDRNFNQVNSIYS